MRWLIGFKLCCYAFSLLPFSTEDDFGQLEDLVLVFPENSMDEAEECRDISILNNLAIEKTENFSIHIVDMEENVFLHIEWLTIFIRDDDCKSWGGGGGTMLYAYKACLHTQNWSALTLSKAFVEFSIIEGCVTQTTFKSIMI